MYMDDVVRHLYVSIPINNVYDMILDLCYTGCYTIGITTRPKKSLAQLVEESQTREMQ